MITEGVVAFSNLAETEKFNGQDTGKYSIVLTLEQEEADKLSDAGIIVKEYKNQPQRKFVTKFPNFPVMDTEGDTIDKYIPYGSKVRVLWEPGKPHTTHSVPPYFKKIKGLEMSQRVDSTNPEEDF